MKDPESYDEAEWKKLKQGGEAFAIRKGREMGVPQEELDRFAQEVILRETQAQNYGSLYRFRKNLKIGTEEDVEAAGKKAYEFFFESGDYGNAASIAQDVYGKDSKEWKRAHEASEAEWSKTEERERRREGELDDEDEDLNVTISEDSTFATLFEAIYAIEEERGLGELHFADELWDNFDAAIAEEVLEFENDSEAAAATKVLEFFTGHGYTKDEVTAFLPIEFS